MTDRASAPRGAVIAHTPSGMPEIVSFVLTAALFAGGFLLTVTKTLV